MCLPAYVFIFGQWTDEGFYPPQMLVQYIPPESQLHFAECRWCRSDADWLASGLEKGSEQQQSSQEMEEAWKKSINVQYENYRLWLQWTLHCLTLSFTSALWMLEVHSPVPLADGPAEVQARVTHRPVEPHILCTGSINNKHSVGWLTFVNDSNTIKTLFNACSCHISLVYTSFWCFRAVHSNMWPQYITCLMVS